MSDAEKSIPNLRLNTGHGMSQIGLGTWLAKDGECHEAIKTAVRCGYRHIDCAFIYGNQRAIGQALRELFAEREIEREELFITSKLWNTFHSKERALQNLQMILDELGLTYLDLCLIHWPMGYEEGDELVPKNEDGTKALLSEVDYLDTWSSLEKAVNMGKVRSIGLSNFNSKQIQRIWENCSIRPSVLQVEIHPYFQQERLVKFCQNLGIQVTAYSPLGSSEANPFKKAEYPSIYKDAAISRIARAHGKTNSHVALRYQIQRGLCIIPKSMNKQRMAENLSVYDFVLSSNEMETIAKLETGQRITHLPLSCHSPNYPWGQGKPDF